MKLFDDNTLNAACKACHISSLKTASIMERAHMSALLEEQTGQEFVHLELGSPGFEMNPYGIAAEKEALEMGIGSGYPPLGGLKEARTAVSRFVKAFLNIDIPFDCVYLTCGSMQGSLTSFVAVTQREKRRRKILFIDPCFSSQKTQIKMLGRTLVSFDIHDYRGEALRERLEQELKGEDVAGMIYSNPNNPAWICLEESEIKIIAELCEKYNVIPIEDMAYFCMDFRKPGYAVPNQPPYPPTIARYTGRYILLLSGSKIFSYAGQRVAAMCIGPELAHTCFDDLATRYGGIGEFGHTVGSDIIDMTTCGPAMTVQYAYARMLNLSVDGVINFVEDTREYANRSHRMKAIFMSHGFSLVYDRDVTEELGDGFFFTISYPGIESGELSAELMAYGVSTVSLTSSGSINSGVRVCSSRIHDHQFDLLEERIAAFEADHPVSL